MDETEFRALLPRLYGMNTDGRVAALKRMTPAQQKRAVQAIARAYVADDSATTAAPTAAPRISEEKVAAIYAARQQVTAPPPTDSQGAPSFGTDAHVAAIYANRAKDSGAEHTNID